jgi:sugar (pentulose or hexulose) kinase
MTNSAGEKTFIAVDLGAGSGRVIAATTDGTKIELEELHRFDNPGTDVPGGSYWNLLGLYRHIIEGLRIAAGKFGDRIVSIGIDTWGCDHGFLGTDGSLLGLPHQYRDPRSEGMADLMHSLMSEADIYAHTGVKTNFYNSSLHLLAASRGNSPQLAAAQQLLFVPDLLAYWLTGTGVVERTIASTSQLLDPRTGDWAWDVIDALGLPKKIFGKIVDPGTVIGPIRDSLATQLGLPPVPVVATACHDTASAVAGIPKDAGEQLWLSSGTWSIMGIELNEPVTSPAALALGFCNELGVAGSVRFLKNICGLWLIQECKRDWELNGQKLDYSTMMVMADSVEPFQAFIDPDDPLFASPGNMPEKIRQWCAAHGETPPEKTGAILRVITDSIALKYRKVRDDMENLTGKSFPRLHAGGGGIQNESLCQVTANALGIEVIAGPIEATSCGNVVTQMIATGTLAGRAAANDLIRRSFPPKIYQPTDTEAWSAAYTRFRKLCC